jgi:sec-independent protein translocase protein TatA
MDGIFGVGLPELIFIFVIALMVFGPKRLPEIAAQLGRQVARIQQMSQSIRAEWQSELNMANELKQEAQAEFQKATQIMPPNPNQITNEIKSQVQSTFLTKPPSTPPIPNNYNPAPSEIPHE